MLQVHERLVLNVTTQINFLSQLCILNSEYHFLWILSDIKVSCDAIGIPLFNITLRAIPDDWQLTAVMCTRLWKTHCQRWKRSISGWGTWITTSVSSVPFVQRMGNKPTNVMYIALPNVNRSNVSITSKKKRLFSAKAHWTALSQRIKRTQPPLQRCLFHGSKLWTKRCVPLKYLLLHVP